MSLIFSFCQYFTERKRRREFRNSWAAPPTKAQPGQSTFAIPAAPPLWNWWATFWQFKLARLEAEPFPSFPSYFIHHIRRYSFAIISVTVVLIVRWLLEPTLEGSMPFSFFLAAVLFTARTQGIWETLLALILGFLLGTWFFAEPLSLGFSDLHDWWAATLYFIVGLGIVWLLKSEQTAWLRTISSDLSALKQTRELHQARVSHGQPQPSRELLASIVENSQEAILSASPEGRILTWNAAATRLLGWSAKEIIGQSLTSLLASMCQQELQQISLQLSRGERLKRRQTILNGKDGLRVESTMTISPVRDQLGSFTGMSVIVQEGCPQNLALLSPTGGLPGG